MKLSDILRVKGSDVVTVGPECAVLDAARVLMDRGIGAVVVVEEGRPVGILSERDVLGVTSRAPETVRSTRAGQVMSRRLVTAVEGDTLVHAMEVMTLRRVRHLPIVRDGALVGIVSIGDVVNALRKEFEVENRQLKAYISGTA